MTTVIFNSSNRELIPLFLTLNLSSCLFILGIIGIVWNKRNLILMMLSIELMFFAISLNFIFFSIYNWNLIGYLYALLIVTTAATETAVGLGLVMVAYRLESEVSYDSLITLRG